MMAKNKKKQEGKSLEQFIKDKLFELYGENPDPEKEKLLIRSIKDYEVWERNIEIASARTTDQELLQAGRNISEAKHKNQHDKTDEAISPNKDIVPKVRRNLLFLSAATSIFISFDINPAGLRIFSIAIPNLQKESVIWLLLSGCLYFLISFYSYGYPGFRNIWGKNQIFEMSKEMKPDEYSGINYWYARCRFGLWIAMHYLLPIALGIYSIWLSSNWLITIDTIPLCCP